MPLPTSFLSTLKHFINPHLAAGKAPKEASHFLAGATLAALPKLKPNCPPDVRPIAVGEVLRQLTGKCLCQLLKNKAMEFFLPYQFGVACLNGAEKVIHTVRQCLDNHRTDDHFVLLKVDLSNAFNLVSRQSVLNECATHFPELLPWASWCYSQHYSLWHTMGNLSSQQQVNRIGRRWAPPRGALALRRQADASLSLRHRAFRLTQKGVHQGDLLGSFRFALVHHSLVLSIADDKECSSLLSQS